MRKTTLTCLLLLFLDILQAQTRSSYQIKAEYIYGNILKHTTHLNNLVKDPIRGGEIAFEWQTFGEKPWHQYLNFPKVGIGAAYLNLGNPDSLGNCYSIYPYINIPLIRTKIISVFIKPGAGVSYLNKTFKHATAYRSNGEVYLNKSNAAIGSHINVYFAGSLNLEIPLALGLSLTGDCGWNHASNGSFVQPNSGINMINTFIGLKYFPNYKNYNEPKVKDIADLKKQLTTEIILSGGVRQLYYQDNQFFPTGSLTISEFYPLTNYYRMGLGIDAFYDGVYGFHNTKFQRTYITADELTNKIRVGVSWQNELIIGRLAAGFHFGLYLYNPLKNLSPYIDAKNGTLNKPLIYKYDIEKEDGWLYTRVSLKYAFTNHLFISLGLKTHLQKAEFIEWGLGYRF